MITLEELETPLPECTCGGIVPPFHRSDCPQRRVFMAKLVGFPIRPLSDTVFMRRVDTPKSSIIVTPDNAKGSPVEGMVLAVGPGRVTEQGVLVDPEVSPGDHVWFIEGFPAEMVVGGEKVLRMQAKDLLAYRRPTPDEVTKLIADAACRIAHDQLAELLDGPVVIPGYIDRLEVTATFTRDNPKDELGSFERHVAAPSTAIPMPPMLEGETLDQYTDRLTGADGTGRQPYPEHRNRQCSIGYHDECTDPQGERCKCPCHTKTLVGVDPAKGPDQSAVVEIESQLDGTHRVVSVKPYDPTPPPTEGSDP